MPRVLRRAVLLTFDNLGEAADLERDLIERPTDCDHPSVAVALPALLETLRALELPATFFVEGINAELYPDAVRAIAADGHEIGLHAWQHERWSELSPEEEDELLERGMAAFAALGIDVQGFRPPGGELLPSTLRALAQHGLRWCSPVGTGARRSEGVAVMPFRWPLVDAYHRMESFADLRRSLGDASEPHSAHATADALLEALRAAQDGPTVVILHPFLLVGDEERAEAERVLRWVAEQVAAGERWVATGRDQAPRIS
jgi:peptidoglycan/xylan/chitin deacetylase (PgdA/CDA1 family)